LPGLLALLLPGLLALLTLVVLTCYFFVARLRGQNFFGFGNSADIAVTINDDGGARRLVDLKKEDGNKVKKLLYYDGETISGKV
jgi:hypothetical protein